MRDHVKVPVKIISGERWGDLDALGLAHEICGEVVKQKPDLSFAGGHRVRLYHFKKNVHWRIPGGTTLDISAVSPKELPAPRRKAKR